MTGAEPARPLTPDARATLDALLAGDDPVRAALRAQLPYVTVRDGCACGCATVELRVDRTAVAAAPGHVNPAMDAWYEPPVEAGVLLLTERGYLACLEIYAVTDETFTAFPDPRLLRIDTDPS